MTTTYTPGDTDKDRVRFLVRDTGADGTWAFTDEEVQDIIDNMAYGDACSAAVLLLQNRAPELARLSSWSRSIGSVSLSGGTGGADFFERAAKSLEDWCRARKPISGFRWHDSELGEPVSVFRLGMHDAPGYPGSRSGHADATWDWRTGQV